MKQKATNGVTNVLDNEELAYRAHVVFAELGAREAKAIWEKYHYTVEADKLREDFNRVMQENFERQMAQREQFKQFKEIAEGNNTIIENEE